MGSPEGRAQSGSCGSFCEGAIVLPTCPSNQRLLVLSHLREAEMGVWGRTSGQPPITHGCTLARTWQPREPSYVLRGSVGWGGSVVVQKTRTQGIWGCWGPPQWMGSAHREGKKRPQKGIERVYLHGDVPPTCGCQKESPQWGGCLQWVPPCFPFIQGDPTCV